MNISFSNKISFGSKVKKDFIRNRSLYILVLPVIAYYIIFHYVPFYGNTIAFKNYMPVKGILGSPWVGLENFRNFTDSIYFARVLRNTVIISLYTLIFAFPAPIILALLFNEIKKELFKRVTQTITYLPHFITMVVVAGMIREFTLSSGMINDLIAQFGGDRVSFLQQAQYFRTIYISSGIWQSIGWGSIIYIAAIAGIDQAQYEAAKIDGASRWRRMWHITLPGIRTVIIILLILHLGNMMNVGYEKILLLYNPATYETADVISTLVYRRGILGFDYGFSTAVGLFNSVINCILLLFGNYFSKKISGSSLW